MSIGPFVLVGVIWTPLASTHGHDALNLPVGRQAASGYGLTAVAFSIRAIPSTGLRASRAIRGKKAVLVEPKNNRGGLGRPPRFRQINGSRTHNVDARGGGDACRTHRPTEEVLGDLISPAAFTSRRLPLEPILYHRLLRNYPCASVLGQIIPRSSGYFLASVQLPRNKRVAGVPILVFLYRAPFGDRDTLADGNPDTETATATATAFLTTDLPAGRQVARITRM